MTNSQAASVIPEFVYHCADILTNLCQGDGQVLVDELLSIPQSSDFDFEIFKRHLRPVSKAFGLCQSRSMVILELLVFVGR